MESAAAGRGVVRRQQAAAHHGRAVAVAAPTQRPELVFVLQARDASPVPRLLSVSEGGSPYVVGFRRAKHVKRLSTAIDPARPLRLVRGGCVDVAPKLNERLPLGSAGYACVTLDVRARLEVPLLWHGEGDATPRLMMRAIKLETFLMYPFEHGLGVAIVPLEPDEAVHDAGSRAVVFPHTHVIDPSEGSPSLLRRALEARMRGG